MGETTKKTRIAVLVTWLVTRVLRRVIGVAMIGAVLTTGLVVAGRDGLDVSGVRRVEHCETRALGDIAKQLRPSSSSSSPGWPTAAARPASRRRVRPQPHAKAHGSRR